MSAASAGKIIAGGDTQTLLAVIKYIQTWAIWGGGDDAKTSGSIDRARYEPPGETFTT